MIKCSYHSGVSKGLRNSCVRNQGLSPNIITKNAPVIPIIQEITRVLGTLCQELRAETKYIFLTTVVLSHLLLVYVSPELSSFHMFIYSLAIGYHIL